MRPPSLHLAAVLVSLAALVSIGACGTQPDDDGGTLACGIAPLVFDPRGDVLQGETREACARVERRELPRDDDAICTACPYDPLRLLVHAPGLNVDVRADANDTSALSYEPSHHNWADGIEATIDGAITRVRILYDTSGGWDLELTRDDDDEILLLPVVGAR